MSLFFKFRMNTFNKPFKCTIFTHLKRCFNDLINISNGFLRVRTCPLAKYLSEKDCSLPSYFWILCEVFSFVKLAHNLTFKEIVDMQRKVIIKVARVSNVTLLKIQSNIFFNLLTGPNFTFKLIIIILILRMAYIIVLLKDSAKLNKFIHFIWLGKVWTFKYVHVIIFSFLRETNVDINILVLSLLFYSF